MKFVPLLILVTAAIAALAGRFALGRVLRRARNSHDRRPALWNRFYAVDWGDVATNNYGFAPANEDHPQRFQREMYRQLLRRFEGLPQAAMKRPIRLLEVSCGRGGGLAAFLEQGGGKFDATGLDVASSAIDFCRRTYGESASLHFVEGSALALPFADGSLDVVLNVEASNDYGNRRRFFAEVARVLHPDGVFLYADTCRNGKFDVRKEQLREAGFAAALEDITPNVVDACREDSERRRDVIRRSVPWLTRLAIAPQIENYAAVEGTRKFAAFASGERRYLMTAATRTG
jgi:ubiquinone/menaquinone biosynthesis C-methylase UbiE